MSVTVKLHIFSGRPNPSWELSRAEADELASRIASVKRRTLRKPSGLFGDLGYQGFEITTSRERRFEPLIYIHGGVIDSSRFDLNGLADDPSLELWLLSTAGRAIAPKVHRAASDDIRSGSSQTMSARIESSVAPPFDPGKWNLDPDVRMMNNCYNYANDKITNTFAQPGRGSGAVFSANDCADVTAATVRDLLVSVGAPAAVAPGAPLVALAVWDDLDFHFYRRDATGTWSHKPGEKKARNVDRLGSAIADPENCDRGQYGFCGYCLADPAVTLIQ